MQPHSHHAQSGIALILVAALLIVLSIAAGVVISSQEQNALLDPKRSTHAQLQEIERALATYQRQHHALPCAADATAAIGSASYGEANCLAASHSIIPDADGDVQVGAVPTRALGISTELAEDAWGNRIIYAVTDRLTNRLNFTDEQGAITVRDGAAATLSDQAAYVLLSAGDNGSGSRRAKTGDEVDAACVNASRDAANCISLMLGGDAEFLKTEYYARNGSDYYDDMLHFADADQQAKIQNRSCANQQTRWLVGTDICAGSLISLVHGATQTNVIASSGTGQADVTCDNGKFTYTNASCAP